MSSVLPSFSLLHQKALELGFDDMGLTKAQIPKEDIEAYLSWLREGKQASMSYMDNQVRCSPQELFPAAQTALIFLSYYKQTRLPFQKGRGLIASYARGRDYHNIHKKRLKKFIAWLEEKSAQKEIARAFSDSSPVLEKALAVQAGLGFIGKNSLLIHRRLGSFVLIAGIFSSLALPEGFSVKASFPKALRESHSPHCGSCRRCLDVCPTQALTPYQVDARQCLSYHLIESKNKFPEELENPGYLFGCDLCQDVCPHNQNKPLSGSPDFAPSAGIGESLSPEELEPYLQAPENLFGSPLNRRGARGLKENFQSLSSVDSR